MILFVSLILCYDRDLKKMRCMGAELITLPQVAAESCFVQQNTNYTIMIYHFHRANLICRKRLILWSNKISQTEVQAPACTKTSGRGRHGEKERKDIVRSTTGFGNNMPETMLSMNYI